MLKYYFKSNIITDVVLIIILGVTLMFIKYQYIDISGFLIVAPSFLTLVIFNNSAEKVQRLKNSKTFIYITIWYFIYFFLTLSIPYILKSNLFNGVILNFLLAAQIVIGIRLVIYSFIPLTLWLLSKEK